jgi:Flp pilus assembly protein TadG
MFDLLRRLAGCTSGAAMLEAAIVIPVAISLMVGGIEFGNLFLKYGTAAKSVRDAARYLARAPIANLCSEPGGLTIAKNLAIYGNASVTGVPLIPPSSVITLPGTDCANPTYVTVQAEVPYTLLMFSGIPFTSISFSSPRKTTVTHTELYIGSLL